MEETSENILKTVVSKIDDLYSIEKKKAQNINILTILGKDSEEVVMCKILWAILNYEENNEKIFLHSFFSDVLKTDTSEDELAAADVLREYCIPQSNRRIDIVIKTKKRFIPIEAKIFAGDQKNQCADYLEYADGCNGGKGKTVLYYLTTNNSKPTYYSVSGNEKLYQQIKSISWVDIHDWLDKRRNISDGAAEVVGQYVKALDSLLDLKKGGYNMSIDNLIDSPDGIKAAIEIENSLTRKKTELLRKIFDKVIDRSKAEFGSDFDMDFNNPIILEENINEYYSRKKSSSTYPSVTINHGMIDSSVDGTEYFFVSRFEIEWRAYAAFGIMMCKNDVISMVDKPTKALIEKVKNRVLSPEIIEFKKGWWLYWEYVVANGQDPGTSEPDFRLMNDAYLELFDESHQDSFVEKVISTLNKLKGCVK